MLSIYARLRYKVRNPVTYLSYLIKLRVLKQQKIKCSLILDSKDMNI